MAAVHADGHPGAAPAVDEQYALLSPVQIPLQLIQKLTADTGGVALAKLAPHIGQNGLRQRDVLIALGQGQQLIGPLPGGIIAFYRGCGRPQQQQAVFPGRPVFGYLPGVVAGVGFGFIGGFLFLIDDDAAQPVHRREHRGPGPDDHPRPPLLNAAVFVIALGGGKAAVHHGHLVPKKQPEPAQHLGGQGDLRHQQNGAFALFQGMLDQLDIHLGLAAAGNAEQQRGLRRSSGLQGAKTLKSSLLGSVQLQRLGRLTFWDGRHSADLRRPGLQNSQRHQAAHQRRAHTGEVAHLFFRELPRLMHNPEDGLPLFPDGALAQLAQRLLQRQRQADHVDLLFPDALPELLLHRQAARFHQLGKLPFAVLQPGGLGDAGGSQGLFRLPDSLQDALLFFGQFFRSGFSQRISLRLAVPNARGKQGVGRLKKGAEIPSAHPQRHGLLRSGEDHLIVKHIGDGLELAGRFRRGQFQNDALGLSVACAEGDDDPLSLPDGVLPGGRHTVIIGTVNGIDRRRHRHPGHHRLPVHGSLPFAVRVCLIRLFGAGDVDDPSGNDVVQRHLHRLFSQFDFVHLRLLGDLAGALGGHVHQQVAVVHFFKQFGHSGMQHKWFLLL